MKKLIFTSCLCFALFGTAHALTIDARVGNLDDPKYSSYIHKTDAEARLHIVDADETFENLYGKRPIKSGFPKGVSQSGKMLMITAPNMPPLIFKGAYWPPGKEGGESDSEYYVYVHEFENYHLIAIQYAHDTASYVLVDKKTLKLFLVNRE